MHINYYYLFFYLLINFITSYTSLFFSESTHQHEVQENDARRARNFRIRRHLSVDDSAEQITQNTEASQVGVVTPLTINIKSGLVLRLWNSPYFFCALICSANAHGILELFGRRFWYCQRVHPLDPLCFVILRFRDSVLQWISIEKVPFLSRLTFV